MSDSAMQLSSDDDPDQGERVADPENYNLQRRLTQLHSAKEAVTEMKDRALDREATDRTFSAQRRDRFVAEKLTDYILELSSLLSRVDRDDEFLQRTVSYDGRDLTLQEIIDRRGRVVDDGDDPIPYYISMQAWDICNRYFEQVAGAVFESGSMPKEIGFDSTEER